MCPIKAETPKRIPLATEPPIRLVGEGPTEVFVLFSLRPPADAKKRAWLKQIDFRVAVLDDAPADAPRALRFTGTAADGETVRMKVVLNHGGNDE